MSVLVLAFASAGGASAQSVTINVRVDNDKLQAFEARFKPGDENKDVPRGARVTRALTSGTLLRTYPDGAEIALARGSHRPCPGGVRRSSTRRTRRCDWGIVTLSRQGTPSPRSALLRMRGSMRRSKIRNAVARPCREY